MKNNSQKRIKMGQRVAELREARGLTQEDLEAESGVSLSGIRKIEQGRTWPRIDTIGPIADVLGVDPEYFFYQESSKEIENLRILNKSLLERVRLLEEQLSSAPSATPLSNGRRKLKKNNNPSKGI